MSMAERAAVGTSLSVQMQRELDHYWSGSWPDGPSAATAVVMAELSDRQLRKRKPPRAQRGTAHARGGVGVLGVAPLLLEDEGVINEAYQRREGVRNRPFAPKRRRTRDGGLSRTAPDR